MLGWNRCQRVGSICHYMFPGTRLVSECGCWSKTEAQPTRTARQFSPPPVALKDTFKTPKIRGSFNPACKGDTYFNCKHGCVKVNGAWLSFRFPFKQGVNSQHIAFIRLIGSQKESPHFGETRRQAEIDLDRCPLWAN